MTNLISQTKVGSTTYDLKDKHKTGIYFVEGTQTAATGAWTGVLSGVDELFDGLTIAYWLPTAGSGNATLNLTLGDGTTTGAINCYYRANSRLTTHYAAGDVVIMTYYSKGSVAINGTATSDARWVTASSRDDGNTVPTIYCGTGAVTAAKTTTISSAAWTATNKTYAIVDMYYANTAAAALTLNVTGLGAKPIWINGAASSTTNYTLPAGTYLAYWDGTNWQFRTDGLIPSDGLNVSNEVSLVYNDETQALDFIFS